MFNNNQWLQFAHPAPPPPAPPVTASIVPVALKQPPANAPSSAPGPAANHPDTTPVQFLVDFAGNGIESIAADKPPYLFLHFDPPETSLREWKVEKIGYDNSWRASFTIFPAKHHIPTEMQCRLMQSNKPNARPLSEEWTYTWHQ